MASDSKMRMPYGPGWEDPDWRAHDAPPEDTSTPRLAEEAGDRPVVSSLAQFMDVVRRFALPRRHRAAAASTQPGLQTRRWVMAGGAGFVALAALPVARKPADPPAAAEARQVAIGDAPVFDRMPRRPRDRA